MSIVIQKAYCYRLEPTKRQANLLAQFSGAARYIYNYGLSLIKQALEHKQAVPLYADIANTLPRLKEAQDTQWLKAIHSQVLQQSLKDLESAQKHFFRRLQAKQNKAGFPRYKKKGIKDSFRYPQGIKLAHSKLYLPKIGWLRYRNSYLIEGIIKQATVKRDGKHWYIAIVCSITKEIQQVAISSSKAIGIDLGLLSFAHMSNGIVIDNPRYLKHDLALLKRLQRKLSRAQKGSSNRQKLKERIAALHIKIKNKRKDFLHKLTSSIVKSHDIIAVESLHIKGMLKNHKLAQSISDVSWSMFISMLKYKCLWYGKHLVEIDRYEPSSKQCSSCSHKQAMPLAQREYNCTNCGIVLNRDYNASLNIKAAGLAVLARRENDTSLLSEAGISGL